MTGCQEKQDGRGIIQIYYQDRTEFWHLFSFLFTKEKKSTDYINSKFVQPTQQVGIIIPNGLLLLPQGSSDLKQAQ